MPNFSHSPDLYKEWQGEIEDRAPSLANDHRLKLAPACHVFTGREAVDYVSEFMHYLTPIGGSKVLYNHARIQVTLNQMFIHLTAVPPWSRSVVVVSDEERDSSNHPVRIGTRDLESHTGMHNKHHENRQPTKDVEKKSVDSLKAILTGSWTCSVFSRPIIHNTCVSRVCYHTFKILIAFTWTNKSWCWSHSFCFIQKKERKKESEKGKKRKKKITEPCAFFETRNEENKKKTTKYKRAYRSTFLIENDRREEEREKEKNKTFFFFPPSRSFVHSFFFSLCREREKEKHTGAIYKQIYASTVK